MQGETERAALPATFPQTDPISPLPSQLTMNFDTP